MLDLAVPDSPAGLYALFQVSVLKSLTGTGIFWPSASVEHRGDSVRLCKPDIGPPGPVIDPCSDFADFTTDPTSNLLTGFSVNGHAISERLIAGGATSAAGGAQFTLVVGYRSLQAGELALIIQVANGPDKVTVYGDSATYTGADGQQVRSKEGLGPFDVQPSATATLMIIFPDAAPGGRLVLEGFEGTARYEVTLAL